jgi:AcrR family transcriptional regulator
MDHKAGVLRQEAPLDARQTRTRAALATALLELLEEGPFDQVTIREITARADIGYATFFRHYPDKQALLHDVAERQIATLLAMSLPLLYTVDTRASARVLCAYVWEHRKLWSALLTGGAAGILRDEFVRQTLREAAKRESPDAFLPDDLRIVFSVTGALEILTWWLRQSEPLSVSRMAEIIDHLVIKPTIVGAKDIRS